MDKREITAGSRIGAMLLDHIVMCFIIALLAMPVMSMEFKDAFKDNPFNTKSTIDWTMIIMVFGLSLYFNKDMIQGKSIAKRALKQEVINIKTGEVASSIKCLIRNITIVLWPIEVIAVLISPSRRIGDFIAGTKVDYISEERNSKPKVNTKNLLISLFIGFGLIYASSFLFSNNFGNGALDNPDYIESSYDKNLSNAIEQHLDSTMNTYLLNVNILVYDSIANDSLKYVAANFLLSENYIDNDSQFNEIKEEIFSSMFEIIPKSDFILMGKFIYDGKTSKKSTWRTYDWRKIKQDETNLLH